MPNTVEPNPSSPARPRAASRTGRRLATALFWLLTVYVIVAGFVSAIPQVFWPAEAYGVAPQTSAACADDLATLRADLLAGAASTVGAPESESVRPFLGPWDQRYRALEASCGALPAYTLLARLRYRVEEHLLRYEADVASLDEETRRALDATRP